MTTATDSAPHELELRLLGPYEVWRAGMLRALPQSKKTRALLAYLAMTGRSHRRERLCDLLWDVTDDPRGALRWSLSKLRRVVNDEAERIAADRETVAFVAAGARIDARELIDAVRAGVGKLSTEQLERLAELARGEFLDGLELSDFHEFQSWCVALREQAREARSEVLAELTRRLRDEPRRALPHARARVQADALGAEARVELLRLLVLAGKHQEAAQQFEIGRRVLREVGAPGVAELEQAWREIARESRPAAEVAPAEVAPAAPIAEVASPAAAAFVGRGAERDRLLGLLEDARSRGSQRVALITGEPGAGKSHLVQAVLEGARAAGAAVLEGRAYEAESNRPYGPWVDALRTELTELETERRDRDALFAAVANATATTAAQAGAAVLVLDDVQWLDRDSAELLHFVARTNRQRPLVVLLVARTGELADNEPALKVLRSLRREMRIEEVALEPMTRVEIEQLLAEFAGVDAAQVFESCAGNPLYALELARTAGAGAAPQSRSLVDLVRERVDRLAPEAAEVLRWGAVLGHAIEVTRLEALSSLELDALVDALEILERHALLRVEQGDHYVFAHDVVREAVYGELSHPRRRLMHQRVAKLLAAQIADAAVANEIARHASLAGDALLGVEACIAAGRSSLRVFANADASSLARRGSRLVQELDDPDRTAYELELLAMQYAAQTPDYEQAAARVRALTERALDLGLPKSASLGFNMLAYLRWDRGRIADSYDSMMQAERVSRSAEPEVRSAALAEAAKCLVLLEKDLEQAEAFVLEADALNRRGGSVTSAMCFAEGMLHDRRGDDERAVEAFREARRLARETGDHIAEFDAVEHWIVVELDRGRTAEALALATELAEIGERLREGSEAPCGRAILALTRWLGGDDAARAALDRETEALRVADAKYRLSRLLTRRAWVERERGDAATARRLAEEALEVAAAIGRASEMALARAVLVAVAAEQHDAAAVAAHTEQLADLRRRQLPAGVRRRLEQTLDEGSMDRCNS